MDGPGSKICPIAVTTASADLSAGSTSCGGHCRGSRVFRRRARAGGRVGLEECDRRRAQQPVVVATPQSDHLVGVRVRWRPNRRVRPRTARDKSTGRLTWNARLWRLESSFQLEREVSADDVPLAPGGYPAAQAPAGPLTYNLRMPSRARTSRAARSTAGPWRQAGVGGDAGAGGDAQGEDLADAPAVVAAGADADDPGGGVQRCADAVDGQQVGGGDPVALRTGTLDVSARRRACRSLISEGQGRRWRRCHPVVPAVKPVSVKPARFCSTAVGTPRMDSNTHHLEQ